MLRRLLIAFSALAHPALSVLVNNSAPMLDVDGNILDCADGTYHLVNGRWYSICVSYGLCTAPVPQGCTQMPDLCGFRNTHNVSVFSSPDLSSGSWQFERLALPYTERPPGILYRPHVVFNAATRLWVLWFNLLDRPRFQGYVVATSPHPAGPYTVRVPEVALARANCGDFDLFVDDDGTGFVIYTCGHVMGIESLDAQFLGSGGAVSPLFPSYFVEAPVLFRRGAVYFALFGWCCCYCRQGSGVMVHTAPHPLGPWTLVNSTAHPDGDVACVPPAGAPGGLGEGGGRWLLPAPVDTPNQGCAYINGTARTDTVSVTRSQQNSLIRLPDGRIVWTGNRWGQAPDGIKGHEPQAWLPLEFNAAGAVLPMHWLDTWEL